MSDRGHKTLQDKSERNAGGVLPLNFASAKRALFSLTFILVALLAARPLLAQKVYPVESQLQLTPPYSLYLNDYTTGEDRLKVNLFLKDLTKSDYPVRLRLKMEGFGTTIVSKNNFYTPPIYLNGGQMRVISGPELQDYFNPQNLMFQGIDLKTFNRNGSKLPEGVYRISIEVEDYTRRQIVSNAGTAVLSAFLSYPPVINQPLQDAKVRALFPQNVIFQWTPRHTASVNAAFNVAYKVRLVEVDPPGRNPNDAIRSSRPLFETITNLTQFVYGPAEPQLIPGNTYALQVQAIDASGRDAFVNQGYSEVVRFVYGEKCDVPLNLLAQLGDRNSLQLSWVQLPMQQRYTVRYREANNKDAQWFEQEVFVNSFTAQGLRPGTTYEYQVKAACDYGYGDYTGLQTFTLPNEKVTSGDIVCGQAPQLQAPTNKKLLPFLGPGMVFLAGDFPVQVTEVQSQGDTFTGRGTIGVPYLNKLSFVVEFKDIQINTDLKLISGKVSVAKLTLEESQREVLKAITITPDKNGRVEAVASNGLPTIVDAEVAVPAVLPVYNAKDNTIKFTGKTASGENKEITIVLKDKPPFTFQDKNGETYEVDQDGKVTHRGTTSPSEFLAGGGLSELPLSPEKATISFVASPDEKYGLDLFGEALASNSRYLEDYHQVPTSQGKVRISWKSVETGRGDEVLANITLLDKTLSLDKLEFRNGQGEKLRTKRNGSIFTIPVFGAPENNDKEVYVFHPADEGDKAGLNLGKLNIASFKQIHKKVVLVPVNGAGSSDQFNKNTIQAYLNNVYKQAAVSWEVKKASNFEAPVEKWDIKEKDGRLDVGNSTAMSAYTEEQKALVDLYKQKYPLEDGTYYLFLVNRLSEADQAGYMVRGGQVGFIAVPGSLNLELQRTIAHELGHGAFKLEHTWDVYGAETKGTTANLMDYETDSTQLWYGQWKYMRNPDVIFRPFEGDDEGALIVSAAMLTIEDESTKVAIGSHKYITPSGRLIALPKPATNQRVLLGFADQKSIEAGVPEGTLLSFTIGQKQYKATIIGNEFKGYFTSSDDKPYKSIEEIPSGPQLEVRVGRYTSACYASGYYISYNNPVLTSLYETGAGTLSETKDFLPFNRSEDFRLSCPVGALEVAVGVFVTDPRKYLLAGFKDENTKKVVEAQVETIVAKIKSLDQWYVNSGAAPISHQGTQEWLSQYETDLDELIAKVTKIKAQIASPTLDIAAVANIFDELDDKDGKSRHYQSLTANERLNLLAVLASHSLTDYNGRELQTLKIITGTPSEQFSEMLDGLAKRKDKEGKYASLLVGLANCIDGANFISYIEHLNIWIKTRYSYNKVELLANQKYLKFKPGFWTGSNLSKSFSLTGTINFTTLPNYREEKRAELAVLQDTSYQALRDISPYEYIIVQFENDFKGYSKGDQVVLPALYVYYLFNEENNIRLLKGSKLAVDIALIAIGVGEVRAAIALGKGAYRTYLIIKAGADLGVGTMDLVIQEGFAEEWSKTEEGQQRLERWNNLNLMFAATTLSASAVDGVISRLGKRTIQTEKEWVQVMDELEEVAKGGKLGRPFVNQLEGFADNVATLASKEKLSFEEFITLEGKAAVDLTLDELRRINNIRNNIPQPDANTIMQKVIHKSDITKYTHGPYNTVQGYITTVADAKHLQSYEDIYYGMRLDYKGTKFSPSDGSCGVIRYRSVDSYRAKIPKSPVNGGDVLDGFPFTGHGFTSGNHGRLGVPEWKIDNSTPSTPKDGAELWELFSNGTETLRAVFSEKANKFIPIE